MALPRETVRGNHPTTLGNQMRRFLTEPRWPLLGHFPDDSLFEEAWSPAVDLKEKADAYVVHADIPGVKPEDVEVTLENGVLTIRGQRSEEREDEKDQRHCIERFSGSFIRRFTLPDVADAENVQANMEKGVLEIRIPKSEKTLSRKIEIKGKG